MRAYYARLGALCGGDLRGWLGRRLSLSDRQVHFERAKAFIEAFRHDEVAQASAEYILILIVVVGIVVTVIHKWFKPLMTRIGDHLKENIEDNFFKEDAFHRLNI